LVQSITAIGNGSSGIKTPWARELAPSVSEYNAKSGGPLCTAQRIGGWWKGQRLKLQLVSTINGPIVCIEIVSVKRFKIGRLAG
jgi:hypothetical protein